MCQEYTFGNQPKYVFTQKLYSAHYENLNLTVREMRLFVDALWSSAGKGLTSWLSFVMSNCEVVTFPLVS